MFTEIEYRYLSSHRYGRLASIRPEGAPQIHPVAFVIDPVTDCIEIGGPRLHETQKVWNIRRDPRVSLVVDDPAPKPAGPGGQTRRGIDIRGAAVLSQGEQPLTPGFGTDIIRVTLALIVAWNLDRPGFTLRSVTPASTAARVAGYLTV